MATQLRDVQTDGDKEINFLKGYVEYSVKARTIESEALWEKAKGLNPSEDREILYLLAIESFFMQQETLYKFLYATKKTVGKGSETYINTLLDTTFNPTQHTSDINTIDDLGTVYPDGIAKTEKDKINKQLNGIIKTCKDLAKSNETLSAIYYALKHGFLVYKHENGIFGLIHPEKEKRLENYFVELGIQSDPDSLSKADFSYIIEMNKRIECAIQDLIALRLLKLGITSL